MLRPVSLLPALVVVVALLGLGGVPPAGAAAAPATTGQTTGQATGQATGQSTGKAPGKASARAGAKAAPSTPLSVTIDTLIPSVIPAKGEVHVTGSVTNRSDETWTNIHLYAFASSTPMTTTAELEGAAATEGDAYVGDRILTEGTYDSVDELAPGDSAQYSFAVPRSEIHVTEPGVYWFGVHALGFNEDGGDDFADGRARTFLPLVPHTGRSVDTALVLPVRRLVSHAPDGSLEDVDRWSGALAPGGSLGALVELGTAAGSRPVSWLVDPSVIDSVRRIAAGNPARFLGPTTDQGGESDGDQGDGDASSPSPSPSPSPSADTGDDAEPSPEQVRAAEAAQSWLDRLHEGLEGNEILTLPYGDVDVAAAAEHDPAVYRAARKRSSGQLEPWGLPTRPAVSSPSGYIDGAGIRLTEPDATILVTDRMFGSRAPAVARTAGRTLGVTSSGTVAGGPGPGYRLSPVAVRQRIVSEAALRLLTPGRKPLIAAFPSTWVPGSTVGFWSGLDLPWLHLTTVADAMQRTGVDVPVERLDYPDSQRRLEVAASTFAAADGLARSGETLQNLLTENETVAAEVQDEAWTDLSYSSRPRPLRARTSADGSRAWIESQLRSVRVDAPKAVILSSGSGRFAATVTNGLDQPVSVRVQALSDPPLKVAVPKETIELGSESKTTVLLSASSSAVGIRNVTLLLTDTDDVPLGSSDDVPIRSNRVSNVIWLIVGTGVALLFGAIIVRLLRRIRAARRTA